MAKHDPNKKPKFEFFNQKTFVFDEKISRWKVDKCSPIYYIEQFVTKPLVTNPKLMNEYGVDSSLNKLWDSESFWCEEIFRHWMDEYVRNLAYAIYRDVYEKTVGNEKVKTKEAEAARDKVFNHVNNL